MAQLKFNQISKNIVSVSVENSCVPFPDIGNGGSVCITQPKTRTERCTVKCDPGYDHADDPNAFEECGSSTNWEWTFVLQQTPIMPCIGIGFEMYIIIIHFTFNVFCICSHIQSIVKFTFLF